MKMNRAVMFLLSCLQVGTATAQQPPDLSPASGTQRMVERLRRLADESDPRVNMFLNASRAAMIRETIPKTSGGAAVELNFRLGYELLVSGDTEGAIAQLTSLWKSLENPNFRVSPETHHALRVILASAHLRRGEQENCIARHGPDSCIFPIAGGGVHIEQRGSRAAITELMAELEQDPANLEARWLLNLAYMTVGEYPDKTPAQFVIPPSTFASDAPFPRFPNVAPAVGLDTFGLAGGCVVEDLDGDDLLDVVVTGWGIREQMRAYRNNGDGVFSERTESAGLVGLTGGLNLSHADYDNDGDADILVLRGAWLRAAGCFPNSLLRNRGDGTFEDVTEAAGLLSFHPTQVGVWADFDGDGWLDLFIGNESTQEDPHPSELYRNNRDGTFTNIAAKVGLADMGFVKGAAWGDFNNDGRPDLYVSRLGQPNLLFRNDGPRSGGNDPGDWGFTDVTSQAGVAAPLFSFPTWFWDYDNDGRLDLFVSDYAVITQSSLPNVAADYLRLPTNADRARLYRNRGDGTFENVSHAARLDRVLLAMGANYGDLENDGWPDAYFGTGDPMLQTLVPNRVFRNAAGGKFEDVTTAGGFGHLQKGHAVAFADFDNDGDQDIFTVLGGAFEGDGFQNALFENPGFGNRWLKLRLIGEKANRCAIGARIRVAVESVAGPREIHAIVSTGGSFGSGPLEQTIGLGDATAIREVHILWPGSNTRQTLTNLALDRAYQVREENAQAKEITRPAFRLGKREQS